MADDQRVYSDEEFAVILRTAAELANRSEQRGAASDGLTLSQMKSAAAQAGIDPTLIEQAARLLLTQVKESPFERLIGGPLRHEHHLSLSAPLDEHSATRLLSAVRINTDFHSSDPGHSSALGMTWKGSGAGDVFSVTARPDTNGTSVSLVIERRETFILTGVVVSVVSFFAVLFAGSVLAPISPALALGGLAVGIGGVLAAARNFWSSSTRKSRERIGIVLDAMGHAIGQSETVAPGAKALGEGDVARGSLVSRVPEPDLADTDSSGPAKPTP